MISSGNRSKAGGESAIIMAFLSIDERRRPVLALFVIADDFVGVECDHSGRSFVGGLIVFTDHRLLACSRGEKGNVFRVTVWRLKVASFSPLAAHIDGDLRVPGRPCQIGAGNNPTRKHPSRQPGTGGGAAIGSRSAGDPQLPRWSTHRARENFGAVLAYSLAAPLVCSKRRLPIVSHHSVALEDFVLAVRQLAYSR